MSSESLKQESMRIETLTRFARIVDTANQGYISFYDFKAFEHFLKQPDVLFKMAFRLYDQQNEGHVTFNKLKEITEKTLINKNYKFNWDCELVNNTFGKSRTNKIGYPEF